MTLDKFKSFMRRNSLTIGFTIIVLALGTILWIQAVALNRLETELDNQRAIIGQVQHITAQIEKNGEDRSAQIDQINRHLDCIVEFFGDPQHSLKTIDDITTCSVSTNGSLGRNSVAAPSSAHTGGTPTPSKPENGTSHNNSDGGSAVGGPAQPGFFRRNILQPIKNLINAL